MKKKKRIFRGVGTALITPFKNGEIDYSALGELIELQIRGGVSALIVGGTTAEICTLSQTERTELYEFAKKKTDGRVPLILGTGSNSTAAAIENTKLADELGADGALVVTPYYNKGTEAGLLRHYTSILEKTKTPLILYNVPARTGVDLPMRVIRELALCEGVAGIKEAGSYAERLIELSTIRDALPLYSGNDSATYTTLALGGDGVISVASNVIPSQMSRLCRLYFEKQTQGALDEQVRLLPFIESLFCETNPAPIKYIMAALGMIEDEIRLPLTMPKEENRRKIEAEFEKIRN